MPRRKQHRPANMMVAVVLGPITEEFKATHEKPPGGWAAFNLGTLARVAADPALLESPEWAESMRAALAQNIDFALTFCAFVRTELWKMAGTSKRAKRGAVVLFMCSKYYEDLRNELGREPDAQHITDEMHRMKWTVPSKLTVKNAIQEFDRRIKAATDSDK